MENRERKKANGIATNVVLIFDILLHLGMNCIFIEYICMWAEMPSGKELTLKEEDKVSRLKIVHDQPWHPETLEPHTVKRNLSKLSSNLRWHSLMVTKP